MTPERASELLEWLCAPTNNQGPALSAAVFVAHPDDESIGAGSRLPRLRKATFIYTTDGAPRNMHDARCHGFSSCEEYASARRAELCAALQLAGISPSQIRFLGIADQEASFDLAGLARVIADQLLELGPDLVLTHPYEGGHPDHDATAFAVHAGCRLLEARGADVPVLIEMTSYHCYGGSLCTGRFLPGRGQDETVLTLSGHEREFKRRLLACYTTQQSTLSLFSVEAEHFRPAPEYDFSEPPHPGTLYYEHYNWGMTGERWRHLAVAALEELGLLLGQVSNLPE